MQIQGLGGVEGVGAAIVILDGSCHLRGRLHFVSAALFVVLSFVGLTTLTHVSLRNSLWNYYCD